MLKSNLAAIREMQDQIEKTNYDPKVIQHCLSQDRDATVEALLYKTAKKRIDLENEPGQTAWKIVIAYYEAKDLDDELEDIEYKLFWTQTTLDWVYELKMALGPFIKGITLGSFDAKLIDEPLGGSHMHKFIRKKLQID